MAQMPPLPTNVVNMNIEIFPHIESFVLEYESRSNTENHALGPRSQDHHFQRGHP